MFTKRLGVKCNTKQRITCRGRRRKDNNILVSIFRIFEEIRSFFFNRDGKKQQRKY